MQSLKYEDGKIIQHVAASAISMDDVIVVGDRIGIAMVDIASGATGSLLTEGVCELTAETGVAWAQGDQLYWDSGNSRLTKTASTFKKAGFAAAVKASAASVGLVKLNA
ncbi:MAG: DUF2190 family protein [Phycisphaerae bacterium]|nr:DUF2190 family protein [Phycisphaerae bacterium]